MGELLLMYKRMIKVRLTTALIQFLFLKIWNLLKFTNGTKQDKQYPFFHFHLRLN